MDFAALGIALLAAIFTGTQWLEARRSRQAAEKTHELATRAHELATSVESRQLREEERSAVAWRPRMHSRHRGGVQFENTGHSSAYDVRLEVDELSRVRHERIFSDWEVEPGDFYSFVVSVPGDLADMPDSVRIRYKLEKYGSEEKTQIVSLVGLMDDFRQIAADDRKWRIEEPIRFDAERAAYDRLRAEASAREAARESQQPAATGPQPADSPEQPAAPAEESGPEQP